MRFISIAVALAGLVGSSAAWAHAAPKPPKPAPSVVFKRPGYETPVAVDISVRTNGVHLRGRMQSVVSIVCDGLGPAGPTRRTWHGLVETTYHKFVCRVTTPTTRNIAMTVLWWADNTYRYDFPGL